MANIAQNYIRFLEREPKNFYQKFFWFALYMLSLIYGALVWLRNKIYDFNFLPVFTAKAKIICVGNISWAGSGKTTLALYLYEKLSSNFQPAILRRGYGRDENKMIEDAGAVLLSGKNRVQLVKNSQNKFNLFIMDDGFGYRKLNRGLNIVLMAAREFEINPALIPASFFREPISSLRRAQILLLTHSDQLSNVCEKIQVLRNRFPHLKIFTAVYKIIGFETIDGIAVSCGQLRQQSCAALCAIGYPRSFFSKLKEAGIIAKKEIALLDHQEISKKQFERLQDALAVEGIENLIITAKDRYRIPKVKTKMNIVIMKVCLSIDNEQEFLKNVNNCLK